ncbi:MAG: hypothetical protein RLZZ86_278 [Cyanobacteriota bacterium]|jgi:hypothetical protein
MDYINGVYIKRKEGKYGEYFVISFKEEGLASLKALPNNQDGFRVVIASPQKADPNKFSVKPFIKKDDAPF